jgi:hypothetical protein
MVSLTKDISSVTARLGMNESIEGGSYCSFAYSALACFRMGMSGSASFAECAISPSRNDGNKIPLCPL